MFLWTSIHWFWGVGLLLAVFGISCMLRRDTREFVTYSSNWKDYRVMDWIDSGDSSDIVIASSGLRSKADCLIKVPWTSGVQPWLQHERNVLIGLYESLGSYERSGGDSMLSALPVLVDECECPAGQGIVFLLDRSYKSVQRLHEEGRADFTEVDIVWIFEETLTLLDQVHRAGWVHGAVLPSHLLLNRRQRKIRLIDWKHAVEMGSPLVLASTEFLSWYPTRESGHVMGDPLVDISLAAQTLLARTKWQPRRLARRHAVRTLMLRCAERKLPAGTTAKDVLNELQAIRQLAAPGRRPIPRRSSLFS